MQRVLCIRGRSKITQRPGGGGSQEVLRDVMREREVFKHMLCNKSSMSENVVFVKLWQKTASKPVNEGGGEVQ